MLFLLFVEEKWRFSVFHILLHLICTITLLCLVTRDAASPIRNFISFWHQRSFLQVFMVTFCYSCAEATLSNSGDLRSSLLWLRHLFSRKNQFLLFLERRVKPGQTDLTFLRLPLIFFSTRCQPRTPICSTLSFNFTYYNNPFGQHFVRYLKWHCSSPGDVSRKIVKIEKDTL